MIKVFYGDDRMLANREAKKFLGEKYEVVEGAELEVNDLPSLFLGNSLFDDKRKILIRDLTVNKAVCDRVVDYSDTTHDVVILESKIAKNSTFYKSLKERVEFREFKLPEMNAYRRALDIYNTAKKDGKKAVKMVRELENLEEPIGFMGMIISIVLKEYSMKQGAKEKRVLVELSKIDMEMKSTSMQPWLLVQSFLLRLASL